MEFLVSREELLTLSFQRADNLQSIYLINVIFGYKIPVAFNYAF